MPISSLTQIDGTNGFRYTAGASGDNAGFSVSGAGDINGDGFADMLVGAPNATGASATGSAYVVFGAASGFAASSSLSSLNGTNGFRLAGATTGDFTGFSVAGAGDIDSDGFSDWLVGSHLADPSGRTSAGSAYVMYGKFSGFSATVALGSLTAGNGARLDGGAASDAAGYSVAMAGDINGDGYADMLVGARAADPNAVGGAGASYLVFGSSTDLPTTVNLATMDASRGFLLAGISTDDDAGHAVGSAGDFNGDGFDDLLIGARYADGAGASAGAAYLVFGKASGFGTQLNLSSLNGAQGFALTGAAAGDQAGVSVSSAGDINADGLDDLLVGARAAAGGKGAAYVVFGRRDPMPASLSLTTLDGNNGFRLLGLALDDFAGLSVAPIGDFNADGYSDFAIGANGNDTAGSQAGAVYILFGASGGFAADLSLANLSGSLGMAIYGAAGEHAGFSVSGAGDVNGDGFSDVAIGSVGGSGGGAVSVVFGHSTPGSGIALQTSGDDTLTGAGDGNAVLVGGAGQDRLVISSGTFRSIDGGAGRDTLALSGAGLRLDLTAMPDNRIDSIEQIELTGTGRNTLILSPRDLLALSDTSNTLRVDGNADDLVGWTGSAVAGATVQIANQFYRTYTQGAATLLVDTDIPMMPREIALASLSASQGLRLTGSSQQSYAGRSVSSAGDVNGDGFDDLLIGAYGRAGPGASNNAQYGAAYVVFGAGSGLPQELDLDSLDGSNGYRIRGGVQGEELGIAVSGVGDINGDGLDDLLIANNPTARPNSPNNFGGYIVFGKTGNYPVEVEAATLSAGTGAVRGHRIVDITGPYLTATAVGGGGDFNGDGLDDLLLGVGGAGANNTSTGHVYVLPGAVSRGADNLGLNDISAPSGTLNGALLVGAAAGDLAGVAVGNAGDVNGDGYDDVIVGAYRSDAGGTDAGAAYVVFGGPTALRNVQLNLGSLSASQGFRLLGAENNDFAGKSVSRAGDVNGDGFGDLLVGAYLSDVNAVNSGAAYLVFGKASGFGTSLSLGTLDGSNGVRLSGVAAGDYAGVSVAAAGDINGDGFDDILVGAYQSDANGENSGATYLVYGKASGFGAEIVLGALNGVDGMRIAGEVAGDHSGRSVQGAGDINGDGFDDLVIGAYLADVDTLVNAGTVHLLFGGNFTGAVTHAGTPGPDSLAGGAGDDAMLGGLGDDTLIGQQGRDVLRGGAGNDLLRGGAGADLLAGGGGQDTADYTGSASAVTVALSTGKGQGGDATGDRLRDIEHLIGSARGDLLVGDGAANRLQGGDGDDSLAGLAGIDTLEGGSGSDQVSYFSAPSRVVAELWRGAASIDGYGGADVLLGIERLRGSAFNDILAGDGGNNHLDGSAGNDGLYAADGTDTLVGGAGNDTLDGGAGTDTADYSAAAGPVTAELWRSFALVDGDGGQDALWNIERLIGSAHNDILAGGAGNEHFSGGAGNDGIYAAAGIDTLIGGAGNDTLDGGPGIDVVDYSAAAGPVTAELWRSFALVDGNGGQDALWNIEGVIGSVFADILAGGAGNEVLVGNAGNDGLYAAGGTDTLMGGAGNDTLDGGPGIDAVDYGAATGPVTAELWRSFATNDGQGGQDALWNIEYLLGSAFNDLLAGTNGDNYLAGQNGADQLYAAGGNDTLVGGLGNDTLNGGAGLDVFLFNTAPGATNIDIVQDFVVVDDTLWLENAVFTALVATGPLAAGQLRAGAGVTTAADGNDFILYNSSTGALYYDADGSGTGAAPVQFALLGAGLGLTVADLVIV